MKKKQNISIAAVLCILSLTAMVWALLLPLQAESIPFTPPPFDSGETAGIPQVPQELGWGELDAQVYRAGICGNVVVAENSADLWLYNPAENTVWLKVRILSAQGEILGQSGLIRPGTYVRSVHFDTLPHAGDAVALKLMAYEPDTYYSAGSIVLNTTVSEVRL